MEWNVFYHNINTQEITIFNVFKNSSFAKEVEKYIKECKDKKTFKRMR